MTCIVREDLPVPETPFFTEELYNKYSLVPTIKELWEILQRYIADTITQHHAVLVQVYIVYHTFDFSFL